MNTSIRRLALTGSLITGMLLAFPVATFGAQADCSLNVKPKSGPPGTEFTIRGTGFSATQLTLTRGSEEPVMIDLPENGDPFVFRLLSMDEQVGKWTVEADGCGDTAAIRVTLPPTATVLQPAAPTPQEQTTPIAAFLLLGTLFAGSTLVLLPRVARSLRPR